MKQNNGTAGTVDFIVALLQLCLTYHCSTLLASVWTEMGRNNGSINKIAQYGVPDFVGATALVGMCRIRPETAE